MLSAAKGDKSVKDTPVMLQYRALKAQHPQAILFFRLGDFYELFGDDAALAAPIMGVVLTKRQGTPMCGVPHHSYTTYLSRLMKAGHKVAIADQLEEPSQAKGIVKRGVTRVVTPGTLVEDELLQGSAANYLAAIELDTVGWGLAVVDASTGEFWATQAMNDFGHLKLYSALAKVQPKEVLASKKASDELRLHHLVGPQTAISDWRSSRSQVEVPEEWDRREIWQNRQLALKAALTAQSYLESTQSHIKKVFSPIFKEGQPEMQLDETAIRTLELVESEEGGRKFTLWGVLDRAMTPMGSRRLHRWVLHPSTDLPEIERRLHCVGELVDDQDARDGLRNLLGEVSDLERVINRMPRARPCRAT